MDNQQVFLNYLLGETTWVTYIAAFLFVFLGLIVKWYFKISRSVKNNTDTPGKFSWSYFVKHNLFTKLFAVVANIVIAFLALRFSVEMFNVPLSMAFATVIGIGFDYLVDKISKWQGNIKLRE